MREPKCGISRCCRMLGLLVIACFLTWIVLRFDKSQLLSKEAMQNDNDDKTSKPQYLIADDEHVRRIATLRNYCESWNRSQYGQPSYEDFLSPYRNTLIIPDIQLTVCQSAKAGSTFWRDYLAPTYHGDYTRYTNITLLKRAKRDFLKVIFVRHPLYRIYSAYNDRVVRKAGDYNKLKEVGKKVYSYFYGTTPDLSFCYDGITFEEYVRLIVMEMRTYRNPEMMEVHRRPYFARCKPCDYPYHIIGKLETATNDVKLIFSTLKARGLHATIDVELMNQVFINDKCKGFEPLPYEDYNNCSTDTRILLGNLEALRNVGLSDTNGFTQDVFKSIPKADWYRKCQELVRAVFKDPVKKKEVSDRSKEIAKYALEGLPPRLLDDLVDVYLPDFILFGYDTDNVFNY